MIGNKLLFITVGMFLFANVGNSYSYQIASNHSYIKNSEFITDYDIKIEGYGDFKALNIRDNISGKSSMTLENEVSININLEGNIDEITKYGIKFIQVINNHFEKEREYYGYLYGYYGKLEVGNTRGVAENMRIGADTIALGSGGIGSSFVRHIDLAGDGNSMYLLVPGTLTSQNFGYHNKNIAGSNKSFFDNSLYLPKISYYSPDLYNFQIGAGFTPNVKIMRENINSTDITFLNDDVDLGSIVSYGINYIDTFNNIGVAISFVYEKNLDVSLNKPPKNETIGKIEHKFTSSEIGANVSYFGLTFAFSKGTIERKVISNDELASLTQKEGTYTTYGFVYELSEFSISNTYFESEYKDYSKFSSVAVAIENKMSKNISVYVEYIRFKSTFNFERNEGYTVSLGMLLNFN
jgi:hypothetical protein